MGTYLYAVAATGRKKINLGPTYGTITLFPMVYRWKYWPWTYNSDAAPIRQSFNLARIERNAKQAIANKDYQGFVALYGIEKGSPVYLLDKDVCMWDDGREDHPGQRIGWLDERVEDGSLFISTQDPDSVFVTPASTEYTRLLTKE